MARLHEYQGKALLADMGLIIPDGAPVNSPEDAAKVANHLIKERGAKGVVLKIQAWTTGRKAMGGVEFADSANAAKEAATRLFALKVGNFPIEQVLVEEMIDIQDELFVSLSIDDAARQPVMLIALEGGSGIEERAEHVHRLPIDVADGINTNDLAKIIAASPIKPDLADDVLKAIVNVADLARKIDARSVEVNPLVTTKDGRVVAADCRVTVDDYGVFRQPQLGIEIARELDHPPTELEQLAYAIEQDDHRGTFYFAQLPTEGDKPIIGFHGAGGGGSMMSMDAITKAGFAIANFTDTSGNPSVAKVYRAARVILAQPDLVGYFGSGSGVASQEQFHSAYGLAKAFIELNLDIPAVIRLGGNSEDRAVEILEDTCKHLPAPVSGFKKNDSPAKCADVFDRFVKDGSGVGNRSRKVPAFVWKEGVYNFPINGGSVWIDRDECDAATTDFVVKHSSFLIKKDDQDKPILAVTEEEIANKDSELIACEIECLRAGNPVVFVDLPVTELGD